MEEHVYNSNNHDKNCIYRFCSAQMQFKNIVPSKDQRVAHLIFNMFNIKVNQRQILDLYSYFILFMS